MNKVDFIPIIGIVCMYVVFFGIIIIGLNRSTKKIESREESETEAREETIPSAIGRIFADAFIEASKDRESFYEWYMKNKKREK